MADVKDALLQCQKNCNTNQRKDVKQGKLGGSFYFQGYPGIFHNSICKIEEGLFLGSCQAAIDKWLLKNLKVTHILCIRSTGGTPFPNDFKYKTIKVRDISTTDIKCHFHECFQFIDEAIQKGGGILVHCYAGVSRSATVVVAYLMKKRNMNLNQALDHVRKRRPHINPNSGFMSQLRDFEKSLHNP